MTVLAHPDDESTTAGGTLARYAHEGVRTVVVTCTNGEFGDRPYGVAPGPDHNAQILSGIRLAELQTACKRLAVRHLELLGYHDSGTADWDYKHQPNVFCNVPVEVVATRIAALFEQYMPQVVLTHEPTSTRHPDHVHAAKATVLAVETAHIPAKLYFSAHGSKYWHRIRETLSKIGIQHPAPTPQRLQVTDLVERQITTIVDVSSFVERKRSALLAHTSQLNNSVAAKVPAEQWPHVFGTDTFIRAYDTTAAPIPEDDLFAGLH